MLKQCFLAVPDSGVFFIQKLNPHTRKLQCDEVSVKVLGNSKRKDEVESRKQRQKLILFFIVL